MLSMLNYWIASKYGRHGGAMLKRCSVIAGILLILALTSCQTEPQTTDVKPAEKPNETREWVVKWNGDPSPDFLDSVEVLREIEEEHTLLVRVKPDVDQEKWRAMWILEDDVEYIQPNFQYKLNTQIDDPLGEETSAEQSKLPARDYFLERSKVRQAWQEWEPERSVTIAVIDTGVDTDNPLIKPHLDKETNIVYPGDKAHDITVEDVLLPEEQGLSEDEIEEMYEEDYSAAADYESRLGSVGHGTSVVGVLMQMLGLINGDKPVPATETTAKIMPIKVMGFQDGEKEGGSDFDMSEAIRMAVNRGADIVSLSLGDWAYSQNALDAVTFAEQSGVLVVAAAGNWQDGINEPIFYPAAFPSVVAVGGVTPQGEYDRQSNQGMGLDIVAPDEQVWTLNVGGDYRYMDGNSFATPQVTAVAAMIMQQNPTMSPAQVRQLLRQTSDSPLADWNQETGYGRLNAYRAITEVPKADIYKRNDNQENAATVSVNDRITAVLKTADDEDWFLLRTPGLGEGLEYRMNVHVQLPHSLEEGVELLVKRPGESDPATYTLTDSDDVFLTVQSGDVYIALRFQEDEPREYLAYELETALLNAPDPYEDNDQQWHAYDLDVEDERFIEGTFHKDGDMDWYRISTPEAGNLSMTLSASTPRIDPVLFVQQLGGNGILVDDAGPMQQEQLQIRVEAGGVYYIRVSDLNISATIGTYQLWVTYEPVVNDLNEPNNRSNEATMFPGPNTPVSAALQSRLDYDWYRFKVWEETDVTVFVTGMEGRVKAELNLYDAKLRVIGQQIVGADNSDLTWKRQLSPGDYYIRVRSVSGEETTPYMIGYRVPHAKNVDNAGLPPDDQ